MFKKIFDELKSKYLDIIFYVSKNQVVFLFFLSWINMEYYRDKLLPNGLLGLMYQVVDYDIIKNLKVIAYNRKDERESLGQRIGFIVKLFPTLINIHISDNEGVISFRYWQEYLRTMLHEIGHVVTDNGKIEVTEKEYNEQGKKYYYIEKLANEYAKMVMNKIAKKDNRLGQPVGWIGGLPGVYIYRDVKWNKDHYTNRDNYRCYRCGGQMTLTDVVKKAISDFEWDEFYDDYFEGYIRRKIKKIVGFLGIDRYYIDKSNRKHLFFNYGEAERVVKMLGDDKKFFDNRRKKDIPKVFNINLNCYAD